MLDYQEIKKDFPIFTYPMNGKDLIYLDNAASSQKPQSVIDALCRYYTKQNANIHRGAYRLSNEATEQYETTRENLQKFLKIPQTHCLVYTRNTTESINLVAQTLAMEIVQAGDEILTSEIEHHSNLLPWQVVAQRKNARLRFLNLSADGFYQINNLAKIFSDGKIKLLALQHVSNAQGNRQPIEEIVTEAKKHGVVTVIDGAQGVPHELPDFRSYDPDFFAFSSHKMLGPTGLGFLIGRKSFFAQMDPFLTGGGMILSVSKDSYKPAEAPHKFEAGTPAIAAVIAFQEAIRYLEKLDFSKIAEHENHLVTEARERLQKVGNVNVYPNEGKTAAGIVAFNVDNVHPHDVASILEADGIAVRAGHHCCEPWMKKNDLKGTVRASFYIYNGPEDVDMLVKGLDKVNKIFHHTIK